MFEDQGSGITLGSVVVSAVTFIFRGADWGFWLTLVLVLVSGIMWAAAALQRRAAVSWPAAPGHVEFAEVQEDAEWIEGMLRPHVLHLAYSYKAQEERYTGFAEQRFRRDADAHAAFVRLKGSDVPVRYDPQNPEVSILDL